MHVRRADEYWSARFGLEPAALYRHGINVVPHARSWQDDFAYVFVRGTTCILSVGSSFVESTSKLAGDSHESDFFLREESLHGLFGRPIHHTVGPAYQGYVEPEEFMPQRSDAVREVESGERNLLDRLKSCCEPLAWEHSGIEKTHSPVFGYFIAEDLVAIAHYSFWADHVVSIGVLTQPHYRGHGYGKYVVSAAITHALNDGHLVLYQ